MILCIIIYVHRHHQYMKVQEKLKLYGVCTVKSSCLSDDLIENTAY